MTDLIIFPYNGNGIEAVDCLSGKFNLIGFVDDEVQKHGISLTGHPIRGRELLEKYKNAKVLAVPGGVLSYLNKASNINSLNLPLDRFTQVVHPSANISSYSALGYNILIMAGVTVTPGAYIGNHVCILPNAVVHHEAYIEDYCWIGSGVVIAGNVKVGRNSFIGSASSLINNIEIGEGTLVGIGSNVIRSSSKGDKIAGNPARGLIVNK